MPPGGVKRHRKSGSTRSAASGTFCVMPEWRNWYTRATQNRVPFGLEGSSPSSGTAAIPVTYIAAVFHPTTFGRLRVIQT